MFYFCTWLIKNYALENYSSGMPEDCSRDSSSAQKATCSAPTSSGKGKRKKKGDPSMAMSARSLDDVLKDVL